jgi:hypothetical protein
VGIGISCEAGSCSEIRGTSITALNVPNAGCLRSCQYDAYGIVLENTDTLVHRNVVQAGCADRAAGIRAVGGDSARPARIENNVVSGRSPDSVCGAAADGVTASAAIVSFVAAIDVHSNTLDGGGSTLPVNGCSSAAVAGATGILRNNILGSGTCPFGGPTGDTPSPGNFNRSVSTFNFPVPTSMPSGTQARLEHNFFVPGATALYLVGVGQTITSIDVINSTVGTGNFASGSCGLELGAASACVNTGTPTGAPAFDFDGDQRDSRPDVGAQEFIAEGCSGVSCSGHGVCVNPGTGAECACDDGYVRSPTDPLSCNAIPNPCSPNPCANDGTCAPDGMGGFTCDCAPGVSGTNCDIVFVELAGSSDHTCGVRSDGTIGCWGSNRNGKATPPSGTFTHIAAGEEHTCAIRTDDTIACFGDDSDGRASPPSGAFMAVTAGVHNTCGLRLNGNAACWGENVFGESTPPLGEFTAISGGGQHVCAIATGGSVVCWGSDGSGQASPLAGSFTAIAAGGWHTCGLREGGAIECWGLNVAGQQSPVPAGPFQAVGAGGNHSCGLRTSGLLTCWGDNTFGQSNPPSGTFNEFFLVTERGCGIRPTGAVVCWGSNFEGASTPP